jgi:surfeit locus 1 family protein
MNPVLSRWLAVMAGVATMSATLALGRWQLQRADDKLAAAALMQRRALEPAWSSAEWPCQVPAGAAAGHALPVERVARLTGYWLGERTVFLDNRPMAGASGFIVLTPLRLSQGPCQGQVVLVQRGWAPRDARDRQRVPRWQDTEAEVSVSGRVAQQPSRTYAIGDEPLPPAGKQPALRQNVDAAFWRAWLGQAPLAGTLLQTDDERPVSVPLRRDWAAPDVGVGKHQAYAAQWFALAAIAGGLTLWFQFIRPRAYRLRS